MNILLNGEKKDIPDRTTVLGLLQLLKIEHQRVAVERNEEIVRKAAYAETVLHEGDALEVVSFMGGGSWFRLADFGMRKDSIKEDRSSR